MTMAKIAEQLTMTIRRIPPIHSMLSTEHTIFLMLKFAVTRFFRVHEAEACRSTQ